MRRVLKIGFVLDDSLDKSDGVQQYILTLGEWLRRQGHHIAYLVGETNRNDIKNIHSLSRNIQVRFNRNRMSIPLPVNKRRLQQLLQKEHFDVLHVQMPYSPMLAARVITCSDTTTAIIGTFHIVLFSRLEHLGSRFLTLLLKTSLRRFDCILSVSLPAQSCAQLSFGLESQILPNVIDYKRLSNSQRIQKYNDGRCTIVFLGRLVERKGCVQLLEALFLLLKSSTKRLRVLICGTGPLENELKTRSHVLGLSDIVEFCGYIEEGAKGSYLASADIAVFPSLGGESFGIVLIEAMAAGAGVVVGGDNSGYRSVLGPWPECLFNPTDPKTFADHLLQIIENMPLRERLHKAQQQAVKSYDVEVVGKELVAHYETAIAKRR